MYYLYGLNISSNIPLPLVSSKDGDITADAFISIDRTLDCPADKNLPFHWGRGNQGEMAYNRLDTGFFVMRGGREILVRPLGGVDDSSVGNCLVGLPMGYLLYQRGFHVLHASVVSLRGNEGAFAFLGMTGMGKSTMAASFLGAGHSILTEDVAAIDLSHGRPNAIPAFPWLKMDRNVCRSLKLPEKETIQFPKDLRKRLTYPLDGEQFYDFPSPLKKCYFLEWGNRFEIETVSRQKALLMMFSHTYRPTGPQSSGDAEGDSFRRAVDFVKCTSFYTVRRPKSLDRLDEYRKRLQDHMRI